MVFAMNAAYAGYPEKAEMHKIPTDFARIPMPVPQDLSQLLGSPTKLNPFEDHTVLQEIRGQLKVLVEISMRQAEQTEQIRQQLAEQGKYVSGTMQSVNDLRSQVNGMRNDLIDVARGQFSADKPFEPQVNQRANKVDSKQTWNERVNSKVEERRCKTSGGNCPSPPAVSVTPVEPQAANAAPANPPVTQSGEAPRGPTESFVSCGFNRSPPGLSLWTALKCEEASDSSSNGTMPDVTPKDDEPQYIAPQSDLRSLCKRSDSDGSDKESGKETEDIQMREFVRKAKSGDFDACIEAVNSMTPQALNKPNGERMTVLHLAAVHGHANACQAVFNRQDFRSIKAGDQNSNTAMHLAALHDHSEVCRVFLEYDTALAAVPNRFGDTPSDIAQRRRNTAVCNAFQDYWQSLRQ